MEGKRKCEYEMWENSQKYNAKYINGNVNNIEWSGKETTQQARSNRERKIERNKLNASKDYTIICMSMSM